MFHISHKKIIFFVLFFIFSIIYILYWKYPFHIKKTNLIPLQFEEIIKKTNENNSKNFNETENFIVENRNVYGSLTALYLAKKYVIQNDLNRAFIQLENALKYTKEENLKNILKLRMIKIKIQNSKYIDAINILKSIKNDNWINIIEDIKGDIFMNRNKKKLAIQFWKKSLLNEDSNASKEMIKMKIKELSD